MRRTHLAMSVIAVLFLSFLLGTYRSAQGWEYARLSYGIYSKWTWMETDVFVEGEDMDELCKNMKIIKPQEKGNLYTIVAWAGSGGWEMALTTKMPQEYAVIWFKRPY